jgi:predicted PurR-regulated permease PerM
MRPTPSGDITRIVLIVLVIALLILGSFWTLLPFLGAMIWATTLVIATWPAMIRLQRVTGGRRGVAVAIMTLLILAALIVPLAFAISALLDAAWRSPAVMQDFMVRGLGPAPEWIDTIPMVGPQITAQWRQIAAGGPEALAEFARPYARNAASWAIAATGGVGALILQFLLIVVLTAILYAKGEVAAAGALAFGRRIGDERGEKTIELAGQAVRSVALGVVVTALVQSLLAGAGLVLTGVPHAGLLTALIFVLCIAQIGPVLVLVPAIAWLYWSGSTGWGTVLLIWAVPVLTLDNILRPILIRRGVQLPMLLIIGGVIGGLVSFGVLGLFVGPVILASTYTLAKAWVVEGLTAGTSEP